MKQLTLKWLFCAAVTLSCLLPPAARAAEPVVRVVASFSILGDLVQAIGGERVQVLTLVGPDADAHAFEPRPADAKTLLGARLLVINGLQFEPWAPKLAKSAGYKGSTLVASTGIKPRTMPEAAGHQQNPQHGGHAHDEADPHAWQNPRNVITYVKNITEALSALDTQGAAYYQRQSAGYIQELEALDAFAQAQFATIASAQRRVITSHDAFGYFAARYQIQFLAPQGVTPEGEPSAKAVAQLIRQIKKDKIRAVFVENMRNPQLLAQIARDTGVTLGPKLYVDALSAPNEPGASYLSMMRHNVAQLAAGMRLN